MPCGCADDSELAGEKRQEDAEVGVGACEMSGHIQEYGSNVLPSWVGGSGFDDCLCDDGAFTSAGLLVVCGEGKRNTEYGSNEQLL